MTLSLEDSKTERRSKTGNATNKSNSSIPKNQSQQNTSSIYWKTKTTAFASSKLLPSKSPTFKSPTLKSPTLRNTKLNHFNEKEINNPNKLSIYEIPKVQKKKSAMLLRQKFLSKNTPLGSFSKKLRSYHQKTKTMSGCMTSRAEQMHSQLQSTSVQNGENNFSSIVSPVHTTKAIRTGNSFDFSSRMADLR